MAPLQKRALFSFIIGLILTAVLATVLIIRGDISDLDKNVDSRIVLYALMIGVSLVYLLLVNLTLRGPTRIDERDRLIVDRSSKVQWMAVIFSLAAWTIGLTEYYRDQGSIPLVFLNVIFASILVISTLARSLGILTGYRSTDRNG